MEKGSKLLGVQIWAITILSSFYVLSAELTDKCRFVPMAPMKSFLLTVSLLASLACVSCSTLANGRDVYRPLKAKKTTTAKAKPAPSSLPPAQ
jgi:hypothetical protein